MLLFVYILLAAVATSAFLTYWVRNTAIARGLKATPVYGRHTHTKPVPRLGGVAICLTFLLAAVAYIPVSPLFHVGFPLRNYFGIVVPVLLIFAMGVYDDLKPLKPKAKVAIEALAAVILYFGGFGIHYFNSLLVSHILGTLIDLPLTILWILLITNAFNLIDGLDGLAAGSALISAITILIAALLGHSSLVTFLVVAFVGAIIGFLPFNRHPASIFMGDSGSLFIGFLLSALSIAVAHPATTVVGVAIPLLAFGLPILDVSLALLRRAARHRPLFRGDTDHIHHKLLKRGFSHGEAVNVLYFASGLFVLGSLVLLVDADLLLPVFFVLGIAVSLGVQQLHYTEFSEFFHPVAGRRQLATDEAGVRRAVEALATCSDFRAICQVLQETLQPAGLDAIRIKNLGKDGYPMALFHSLRYDQEGRWHLEWSERKSDDDQWGHRFELLADSPPSWGYASLLRGKPDADVRLNRDLLAEAFRYALAEAVIQATLRMDQLRNPDLNADLNLVRAVCRASD
jgi:UDP-GlcNAc:undecaprenyl-phosphate/decaprenyl-phosphate GlcNAc-1-phosphate transferase